MNVRLLLLFVLLIGFGGARDVVAAPMSIKLELDLYFDPSDDGIDIAETFFRPTAVYHDRSGPYFMQMNMAENIGKQLPSSQETYYFWSDIPDFPAPSPAVPIYGGFFSYYSYCDFYLQECDSEEFREYRREGMFVGLSPHFAPVENFDTQFNQGAIRTTEASALAVMKRPNPPPFDVHDSLFYSIYFNDPGLLPTWKYDPADNAYKIDMNIWAYSSPVLAGTMRGTATFASVPAPTTLTLLGSAMLAVVLGLRRRPRTRLLAGGSDSRGP